MGSAKVLNVQPHLPMAEEKKSIKNIFKKPFQALFQKNKKKERIKEKDKIDPNIEVPKSDDNNVTTPVADILDKLKNLDLKNKDTSDNEDEFDNFSYKIIKDEVREKRNDSHSSEDSGFAEKCINNNGTDFEDENYRDLVDSFDKLSVDQHQAINSKDGKKPKRLQKVVLQRGPINSSTRRDHAMSAHPYCYVTSKAQKVVCGLQTMAGGQVIVNSNIQTPENCTDIETALKLVDMSVTDFVQNSQQEQVDRWQIAQEYVNGADQYKPDDMLSEFISDFDRINPEITNFPPNKPPTPNPVEEFSNTSHTFEYDIDFTIIDKSSIVVGEDGEKTSILLTPPRSENVPSPMSDSQTSFYPTTDHTLSSDTSSPMHYSDYEKYQDISPIEDYPSCVIDYIESDKETDKKKEKSSMTMKQFKDLQKQIATDFSKKECCQINRKLCKVIFEEHIQKLDIDQRKDICYKVSNLDFKTAYGVLHHILFNLSNDKDVDINMALFSLICEKVLALRPLLFVEDFGLNILKLAVLRCYTRPLLTRYIVQCIRTVTRSETYKRTSEYVFSEVDTLGDNLVIACARAGDECADVLSELVRCEDKDVPLFNIHHANIDGYTAMHVCCAEHSARAPHAHALHVLLRHGGADLWRGDIKGGDTPLHVAVNSPNCDLTIVMILFQHIDRKEWRKLAHVPNRSSVNPLEYARSAVKSTTRQNYPIEVLDFLKKCR